MRSIILATVTVVTLAMPTLAHADDNESLASMRDKVCASVAAWAPVARVSVKTSDHATLVFNWMSCVNSRGFSVSDGDQGRDRPLPRSQTPRENIRTD